LHPRLTDLKRGERTEGKKRGDRGKTRGKKGGFSLILKACTGT